MAPLLPASSGGFKRQAPQRRLLRRLLPLPLIAAGALALFNISFAFHICVQPRWPFSTLCGVIEGLQAPYINDISTDLEFAPAFIHAKPGDLPENFKKQIRHYYADLDALVFPPGAPRDWIYQTAVDVARGMPAWEVTHTEEAQRFIESVVTTPTLKFHDDVIIRVAEDESGAVVVDMRSRSRLGKGDFGTNAHRIRTYLAKLRDAVEAADALDFGQ